MRPIKLSEANRELINARLKEANGQSTADVYRTWIELVSAASRASVQLASLIGVHKWDGAAARLTSGRPGHAPSTWCTVVWISRRDDAWWITDIKRVKDVLPHVRGTERLWLTRSQDEVARGRYDLHQEN